MADWWCTFHGRVDLCPSRIGKKFMRCPLCNKRLLLRPKYCNCCTPNVLICYTVSRHKVGVPKRKKER